MNPFVIVVSEFNSMITEPMAELCKDSFMKRGIEAVLLKVPGAMEIPLAVQKAILKHQPLAVVALGCVIRGETDHFNVIRDTVPRALMELSLKFEVPVVNEILMVNSYQEAEERIQKAEVAAEVAIQMSKFTP